MTARHDGGGPGGLFGANVDSLHILPGAERPPNVPLASEAMARYDYWEKEYGHRWST